ncbi:hypothetical protein FZC76_10010 [Sutcliffiella horikoshii]|uniref:DUF3592 domain-containing protein n=1 Tax=Sutcliffiella horikoshii TaxID=79883 RepID=A0A5D4SYP5_9BACI|nr:hypothetical protein [Sutcliffiella horikoshii]TYS68079.1 hypothetical protein FZC76_10010 [Sutcliffiella horikoshii]
MKKKLILCLLFTFFASNNVYAMDWAYTFVVYKGGVYEVTEERLTNGAIGNEIGEVKRKADEYSGNYYGDASNHFDRGTKYYEIEGVAPDTAIAIEERSGEWVKAVYLHEAPFYWTDLLPYILLGIVAFVLFIVYSLRYASKRETRQH